MTAPLRINHREQDEFGDGATVVIEQKWTMEGDTWVRRPFLRSTSPQGYLNDKALSRASENEMASR